MYKTNIAGNLRRTRTLTEKTTNLHGLTPMAGEEKSFQGSQAPMYKKQPQFKMYPITAAKDWPRTCFLSSPLQEIAQPKEYECGVDERTDYPLLLTGCEDGEKIVSSNRIDDAHNKKRNRDKLRHVSVLVN